MTSTTSATPFIGVLMLDTTFPRILGDAGNMRSYGLPARSKVVCGAGSLDIVKNGQIGNDLVQKFCSAATVLEAEGAGVIVSTCGFLVTIQVQIAACVNIPVMVSSLSLFNSIKAKTGASKIGILTASKSSLGHTALNAAGISMSECRIGGLEDCPAFKSVFLQKKRDQPNTIDTAAIEAATIDKAIALVTDCPEIGAFLLECGNLPPYATAIQKATGRPVYSILDAAKQLWQGSKH